MKQWLAQPIVRGLIVGAVIIATASGLKLYMDRDVVDPDLERAQIDTHLFALHDALSQTISEARDRDEAIRNLPDKLPWLPEHLACADAPRQPSSEDAAAWRPLGWPLVTQEKPRAYAYQISMRRTGSKIVWFARRDTDCDGIFEIHTLRGDLGWSDAFKSARVETQHLAE